MKDNILSCIIGVILLLFSNITVSSSTMPDIASPYDSVHISLLTCSSHPEVYSLYGHTAVRYRDMAKGQDYVINYGVFDFSQNYFVLRFTFGVTDYSMGVIPFYYFVQEYKEYGSSITEQEINLTAREKEAVAKALAENYLPQNRVYRYNCFYKNCSTMARDIIVNNIDGSVVYPKSNDKMSFRDMTHSCNNDYPWAKLGNDLLLGMGSDLNTTTEERHFLPENLMNSFDGAYIQSADGRRPLVKSKTVLLNKGSQIPMEGFPLTPVMCAGILFAICAAVCLADITRKKVSKWFDTVLITVTGIAGILVVVMFFSQHPSTSTNLMVFMLNPLPLFFLRSIYKAERAQRRCIWWKIWTAMAVLTLLSAAFLQDMDMSMVIVAVVILLRSAVHLHYEKKMNIK